MQNFGKSSMAILDAKRSFVQLFSSAFDAKTKLE